MPNSIKNISIGQKIQSNKKVDLFEVELEFSNSQKSEFQDIQLFYKKKDKDLLIKDLIVLERCKDEFPHGMIKGEDYYDVSGFNSKTNGFTSIDNLINDFSVFKHWEVLFPADSSLINKTACLTCISIWFYNELGDQFHVDIVR